jgi:hypothetical protein
MHLVGTHGKIGLWAMYVYGAACFGPIHLYAYGVLVMCPCVATGKKNHQDNQKDNASQICSRPCVPTVMIQVAHSYKLKSHSIHTHDIFPIVRIYCEVLPRTSTSVVNNVVEPKVKVSSQ